MQNNLVLIPTHLIQSLLAFAKAHEHSDAPPGAGGAGAIGAEATSRLTPVGNAIPEVEALLAASKGGFADVAAVACLSTCHITAETNGMLELAGDRNPWFYGQYESGYWIWVPQEDPITGAYAFALAAPEDIRSIWSWARERGFFWLHLDADGSIVDGLPTHSWESSADLGG